MKTKAQIYCVQKSVLIGLLFSWSLSLSLYRKVLYELSSLSCNVIFSHFSPTLILEFLILGKNQTKSKVQLRTWFIYRFH